MKPTSRSAFRNPFLSSALAALAASAAFLCAPAVHATDYGFGSVTENFTLTATDQARALPGGTASGVTFHDNGFGGVYDRGAERDATYMHFNLSSLAGGTINGTVSLNLTIDATYGGAINSGVVGSATNAWSYPGTTGGITTISGADPSGTYTTGQIATAVIDNTTFQGFVTNPSTFNGLAITAGASSTAHFSGPATLTGNATTHKVAVLGGTDWSTAVWNDGTSTLSIAGASDVSGGSVTVRAGTTVAVTDSATLGGGTFSGAFTNSGTLAFGSSANQTLSGAISGTGALEKNGSGTLTLNGAISYKGGTTVNEGTLELPGGDWVTGDPWSSGGASGAITVGSEGTLSTSNGVTEIKNGLTLNGGTVSSRGLTYDGVWGNLFLSSNITAGGTATSTITSQINLSGSRTITVGTGSTLNVTGKLNAWNSNGSGITKEGAGTLALSGANGFTGVTDITAGTLLATNSSALGESGWSSDNMTWVRDGATLAIQGNVSINDHMHVFGAGVGGLGAIRSLSGDNALTMTFNNSGSGPGFSIDSNTTIGVDAGSLTATGFYETGGSFGISKVGDGTLSLSNSSTYTGATTVSAGTLLVNGVLGGTAVTVGSDGTIGGSGSITGSLNFDAGANLAVNFADPLSITGAVTFDGFDFTNIVGWNYESAENGNYTLLAGSGIDLTNVAHVGLANALDLGDGRSAYFQTGSLQVVVIPEPRAALLGGLGMLALLRRRRA